MTAARRRLLIVAHPDDETLWCGALLIRYPGPWTVIACSTPAADPARAWRFQEACHRLGAVGHVQPFAETYDAPLGGLEEIELGGYDLIVTHGAGGEYGHPHHVQVNRFVTERARCPVLTIGWGAGRHVLELTPAERAAKLHALKAYDHVLPYEGTPMAKWEALLARYGAGWLEREHYDGC